MKAASVFGLVLLSAVIIFFECRRSNQKKAGTVSAGVTLLASLLAIMLLFYPSLPGPTQFVKLIYGKFDNFIK